MRAHTRHPKRTDPVLAEIARVEAMIESADLTPILDVIRRAIARLIR